MVKTIGKKEVTGSIKLTPTTAPASEVGRLYFDSSANALKLHDGSAFRNVIDSDDVGTGANKLVQLDGSAKLPAVDASNLTNLPSPTPIQCDVSVVDATEYSGGSDDTNITLGSMNWTAPEDCLLLGVEVIADCQAVSGTGYFYILVNGNMGDMKTRGGGAGYASITSYTTPSDGPTMNQSVNVGYYGRKQIFLHAGEVIQFDLRGGAATPSTVYGKNRQFKAYYIKGVTVHTSSGNFS